MSTDQNNLQKSPESTAKPAPLVLRDPFWERQGEGPKPFEAFVMYRDWDDDEGGRSLAKVATKLGKSVKLIERWSRLWKWGIRVQAWDSQQDRDRTAAIRKIRIDAVKRHINLGQGMQHVAAAVVQRHLREIEEGKVPNLTPKETKEWMSTGVTIERLGLGQPTEHVMTDTPEMAAERRLRDAVSTVREQMREEPDLDQETLVEWAVETFSVDIMDLTSALAAEVTQTGSVNN